MQVNTLHVWLDKYGAFEHVGTLSSMGDEMSFGYDRHYSMPAISVSLPVQTTEFSPHITRAFFSGLTPEGGMRDYFIQSTHATEGDYAAMLERLNDESLGALVFSTKDQEPGATANYELVPDDLFLQFATNPTLTASRLNNRSRLSLTGAMAKIGLYKHPDTGDWYIPFGAMPSTHILKAGSDSFPYQTINEALCMETARLCGFDVPRFELIAVPGQQPLFLTERYDRIFHDNPIISLGFPKPRRLHQEDFGQATSIISDFKYEPTDGDYFTRVTTCASTACSNNSFGESQLCTEYQFFNYLIGNCDNHLKNFSLLYSLDMTTRQVAPLYDVTCTTIYDIDLEMGVSFGGSRRVTDVTRKQIIDALQKARRPVDISMDAYDELSEVIPSNLMLAADNLANEGHEIAIDIANVISEGIEHRRQFDGQRGKTIEAYFDEHPVL